MKKRVLVYLYPQFREVEVMTALSILGKRYEVLPFSILPGTVTSECGLFVQPVIKLKNIQPRDFELLIVPGGRQIHAQTHPRLLHLAQMFHREGIQIAAVGNGACLLGKAGLLEGKSFTATLTDEEKKKAESFNGKLVNKPVAEDRNIITAKSNAYNQFGLLLGDRLNCIDGLEEYNFFKGTS